MIEKLKTLFWIIRKGYTIQIASILKRSKHENTRKESTTWCKQKSKPIDEVLNILDTAHLKLEQLEKENFKFAVKQENECPVKMGGRGAVDV